MASPRQRKYGTADKWMAVGLGLLTLGAGAFSGSFAASGLLADFELGFRLGGAIAGVLGLAIVGWGIRVWRYNLKHDETPTAVVVGTSTASEDRWATLTERRDALDVERAGLEVEVMAGGLTRAISILGDTTPQAVEMSAKRARAQKRLDQVHAEIRAINTELRERMRSMTTEG